jgi:hypothetical protein
MIQAGRVRYPATTGAGSAVRRKIAIIVSWRYARGAIKRPAATLREDQIHGLPPSRAPGRPRVVIGESDHGVGTAIEIERVVDAAVKHERAAGDPEIHPATEDMIVEDRAGSDDLPAKVRAAASTASRPTNQVSIAPPPPSLLAPPDGGGLAVLTVSVAALLVTLPRALATTTV